MFSLARDSENFYSSMDSKQFFLRLVTNSSSCTTITKFNKVVESSSPTTRDAREAAPQCFLCCHAVGREDIRLISMRLAHKIATALLPGTGPPTFFSPFAPILRIDEGSAGWFLVDPFSIFLVLPPRGEHTHRN